MTEKELKKLSRAEILQMLIMQTERVEQLENELKEKEEYYQCQMSALEEALADKRIRNRKAGSIAAAALEINGVLEAAQKAADQYLDNIRYIYQQLEKKNSEGNHE